jgi:hypothetical protein
MMVHGSIIYSRPDTGCEENIMQAELASGLGLKIDKSTKHRRIFRIANGRNVQAVGLVSTKCYFSNELWRELDVDFYVFSHLVTQIIMGMSFLDTTKTLVDNRHRLRIRKSLRRRPFRVSRLNNPRRRLPCFVASFPALANPDTGSDVDLMSLSYVTSRGFLIEDVEDEEANVEFADGSTARLTGKVKVDIALDSKDFVKENMTFYVLENLTCDILLGEDFIFGKDVFQKYQQYFIMDEKERLGSEVSTIIWQKKAEKLLSRLGFRRKRSSSTQQYLSGEWRSAHT